MLSLQHEVDTQLSNCSAHQCKYIISFSEVLKAVHALKHNKRDAFSGLSFEHIINACNELFVHISLLFSSLVSHGTVTNDLLASTMVPIPKGKNVSNTSSINYRAITLSSILGKLL